MSPPYKGFHGNACTGTPSAQPFSLEGRYECGNPSAGCALLITASALIRGCVIDCNDLGGCTGQSIQVKMQDLVIQMKDMELRLNQAINQIQKVGYQQPVVAPTCLQQPQASVDRTEMTASTETIHDEDAVPEVVAENNDPDIELDPNGPSEGLNANASDADTADLDAAEDALADLSIPETVDEPAVQPEVPEEKPIVEEKATEPEPITEEQPAAEEKPAMPDLSDPNKKMSPDEIAALFANMSGDASKEEDLRLLQKRSVILRISRHRQEARSKRSLRISSTRPIRQPSVHRRPRSS